MTAKAHGLACALLPPPTPLCRCQMEAHSWAACLALSSLAACPLAAAGSVRLVNGPTPQEGRLEVRRLGANGQPEWGTVCDDGFDDVTASVSCQSVRFGRPALHGVRPCKLADCTRAGPRRLTVVALPPDAMQVVCGQLGLGSSGIALGDARYGKGAGPIFLDDVKCRGGEERLQDCAHRPWGQHDCDHGEDVGVRCF